MDTVVGPLGFTTPVQSLLSSSEVKLTPTDVATWCQTLPMADMGVTAKKIYHVLGDCNKVALPPKDRFAILEQLHPFVKTISTSLSKHFTNQSRKLNKQQLMIASLAQTLLIEMANGYKLVVEQGMSQNAAEAKATLLGKALQKIVHYHSQVLFQNYQLYSLPPKDLWKELHLSYKIALKHQILTGSELLKDYKRVLLLASSDPFQWHQSEQREFYKATNTWAELANILTESPTTSQTGLLIVDLNEDKPPSFPSRGPTKTPSTIVFDVNAVLTRIKTILTTLEPNEFRAKMSHNYESEYGVSIPMLKGLIQQWGTNTNRLDDRSTRSEQVKICVGLIATHYYLNNQKPFQAQQQGERLDDLSSSLPALTVEEDTSDISASHDSSDNAHADETNDEYPLYPCTVANENTYGYGLVWPDDAFPPIQAGEIIAMERTLSGNKTWEICKINWLQHQNSKEFRLGIERISNNYKVGAAQMLEGGKPAGVQVRCLLLESTLIVPILPFRSHSRILFTQENEAPTEYDLTELSDATSSYKQFNFTTKQMLHNLAALALANSAREEELKKETATTTEDDSGFESIWNHL